MKDESIPTIDELKALQRRLNLLDVHLVYLGPERFTVAHTDEERATIDLNECELHRWLHDGPGPPEKVGYYVVTPHEVDAYSEPYPVARFDFIPLEEGRMKDESAPHGFRPMHWWDGLHSLGRCQLCFFPRVAHPISSYVAARPVGDSRKPTLVFDIGHQDREAKIAAMMEREQGVLDRLKEGGD